MIPIFNVSSFVDGYVQAKLAFDCITGWFHKQGVRIEDTGYAPPQHYAVRVFGVEAHNEGVVLREVQFFATLPEAVAYALTFIDERLSTKEKTE